ncbi:MAG: anthrone oxygenase family protein [Saprospiraceae bacterium]
MNNRVILWTNLTIWYFLCVGMVFDMMIVAANWKGGDLESIKSLRTFFHVTNPGDYFMMKLALLLFAIISPIVYWRTSKAIRNLLLIALAVTFVDMAFTIIHFLPINEYVGWYGEKTELDPLKLKEMCQAWWNYNFLRIALDFVGLIVSGLALHKSYKS